MSIYVCLSVCLSISSPVSKTTRLKFAKFPVHVIRGRIARSSSDDNGICHTSGFVHDVIDQAVMNFQRIRQVAPHCLTLSSLVVYNGSKLCTGDVSNDDMRGATIGWWPAACGIKARNEVRCLRLPC